VDVPVVDTAIATNHLLPLYWGCDQDWAAIPGFSPSTLFPELVLEDGTSLGQSWEDYLHFPNQGSDSRIAVWRGPALPANSTITIRTRWDGWCVLQTSVCPTENGLLVDCGLADSCCNLDVATPAYTNVKTFRTGPGPDLSPPAPTRFSMSCTAYQSDGYRWTVAEILDVAGRGGVALGDAFEIRFSGRREDEPEAASRLLAREIRGDYSLWPTMVALEGPYARVGGSNAIAALQGTWILTAETVDYAGNVSPPSEPVRFVYPDTCTGVSAWTTAVDAGGDVLDAGPLVGGTDASDARAVGDAIGGSTADPGARAGGCGCRIGSRGGFGALMMVMLVAALRRRRLD
jgi:hypothetical protein